MTAYKQHDVMEPPSPSVPLDVLYSCKQETVSFSRSSFIIKSPRSVPRHICGTFAKSVKCPSSTFKTHDVVPLTVKITYWKLIYITIAAKVEKE